MISEIKNNLISELAILRELGLLSERMDHVSLDQEHLVQQTQASLKERLKILNRSVGVILQSLEIVQKLPGKDTSLGVERVHLQGVPVPIALRNADKGRYLQELSISEGLLKKLHRLPTRVVPEERYKRANYYFRIANVFFLGLATRLLEKGKFKNLNLDLRKANLNILTTSYLSALIFTSVLAGIVALVVALFMLFFSISLSAPYIVPAPPLSFIRIIQMGGIVLLAPLLSFIIFFLYPSIERKGLTRRIDSELPFVVIHMGSIAGSGVEPTQIFKIVGLSKDYKHTRGEIRKLLNQVNVYGYDLITALKNVARLTPSTKLAELFNGLATTISSGGELKNFFEKRAESLLLSYRIEREKFAKVAETFMDLYISVVIAAPMILLLLLVMISVSGINVGGFTPSQMTGLILLVVGIINVLFLWVITLKQPSY